MRQSIFILLCCLPTFGWGTTIEFSNIKQEFIPIQKVSSQKSYYKLTSQYRIEKLSNKDTTLLLLNRKNYMLKNNYYRNGTFQRGKTFLYFKKAYVLGGNVHLFDVTGTLEEKKVRAKEVVYDGFEKYLLKKCEIRTKSKIYRRHKYIIKEK